MPQSGRPAKTTERTDNMIHRLATINPFISSTQIHSELQVLGPNVPSPRTIRRRLLKKFKLKAYKPASKPFLSYSQRQKRVRFAKEHLMWTKDMWRKTLFSDESTFSQFFSYRPFVRRPAKSRLNPRYTRKTIKHPPYIMVWGAMSGAGTGPLFVIPKKQKVNGQFYLNILQTHLRQALQLSGASVFQQDGARAHIHTQVREWLATNNIQLLDWPGNSPYLNPIENLWGILKRKIAARRPSNERQLIAALEDIWRNEIDVNLCRGLCESMTERLHAVIDSHGFPTDF